MAAVSPICAVKVEVQLEEFEGHYIPHDDETHNKDVNGTEESGMSPHSSDDEMSEKMADPDETPTQPYNVSHIRIQEMGGSNLHLVI